MSVLEIKNLHVSVEDKEILKGLNLTLKTGEIAAIMGPNGTGKSTLSAAIMGNPNYEITEGDILFDGESILDGTDNVLKDQSIRFTKKENLEKYPGTVRRIVYYAPELHRSFVYYTNNFFLSAKDIALLYKYRWQVELFFK